MTRLDSSFRDPSGFLFERNGELFRQVNLSYKDEFDRLSCPGGLFESLVSDGVFVGHQEVDAASEDPSVCHKVIQPERLPFISYPYEWSFSQLKDAALLTLRIQKSALDRGFSLKDASAFNVQFVGSQPIFIDTLSFESYQEGLPWVAYRQFCQHFLAPLAVGSYCDFRLTKLLRTCIDGIPLDLASRLLPRRSKLRFGLWSHIHLHAASQRRHAGSAGRLRRSPKISKFQLSALLSNLESTVSKLQLRRSRTEWGDYYDDTNYTDAAIRSKLELVAEFTAATEPTTIWDLGANTGVFTRAAVDAVAASGAFAVSCDLDENAVERNYLSCRSEGRRDILPLVMDLTNPSPSIGWAGSEREGLIARGPADLGVALALIHHLAISNNVPLDRLAEFFCALFESLIIEFVPKSDSQVRRLLETRDDVFPNYDQQGFERDFGTKFRIERSERITGSERVLYLMKAL